MPRKSGTGCITCRIRRVKCDEARPHCRRCVAARRQCDGYMPDASTVTRRQLADAAARSPNALGRIRAAPSQSPQGRSRSSTPPAAAVSAFDLFRHATAPSSARLFPSDFWPARLLQLAHAEPAVWHAVLALGTLHRRWDLETREGATPGSSTGEASAARDALTRHAIENYALAVSHARDLSDPPRVLALCLALIAVAHLLGNWDEARIHIAAGLRLVGQAGAGPLARSAAEVLSRQDLQAMTFTDSTAPYPYEDAAWLTQADVDLQRAERIDSYAQATTALFALLRRAMLYDEALGVGTLRPDEQGPRARELVLDLYRWEAKMGRFEAGGHDKGACAFSVRLYHALLRLLLHVSAFGPETRWDAFLGYFERIITCAEALLAPQRAAAAAAADDDGPRVSLELGLTLPLYVVASHCRHAGLRRRAVQLLRELKTQEGKWNSIAAAAVAEKIIAVEEGTGQFVEGSPLPPGASLDAAHALAVPWEAWATRSMDLPARATWEGVRAVPEERRCCQTIVMASLETRRINLTMLMSSGDDMGSYGPQREEVLFF